MSSLTNTFSLFLLFLVSFGACGEDVRFTPSDLKQVRTKLEAYSAGKLTLDEVSNGGEEWCKKVIIYHLNYSNEVSLKMKLPIAKCYALGGIFTNATQLTIEYMRVYTNDARGWDLLFATKCALGSFEEGFAAGTNAIHLGCDKNLVAIAGVALKLKRLDALEGTLVPRLFLLKDENKTSPDDRRETINMLVVYSLQADKKDVFIRALEGVDSATILADPRFKRNVEIGCKLFDSKETEKIRELISSSK
jgi:hypothetical protein